MPSVILLAEKAGQALQTQLLRLNEFMGNTHLTCRGKKKKVIQFIWMWLRSVFLLPSLADVPPYKPVQTNMAQDHAPAGETQDFLPGCLYCKQEGKKTCRPACVCVCMCVQVTTSKRWSFTVNWKTIAFSSHWRTTQQHATCSTCERFSRCSSKRGEQTEIQQNICIYLK